MSVSGFDSPTIRSASQWVAPEGWLQTAACRLAAYLPLEGLMAGRRVLDVNGLPAAQERLRRARARSVVGVGALPWKVPNASMDVVLVLEAGKQIDAQVLQEVKRVLAPQGFVVWRLEGGASLGRAGLLEPLTDAFPTVESIGQVPVAGFTFDRGGCPDVVVAEDLFPTGAAPSHVLAFCTAGAERAWKSLESWVVPLHRPSVEAPSAPPLPDERAVWEQRIAELNHEREYLREAVMTLQDERDRLERLAANLRRDADRNLARLSDQAAALEVLGLERDHTARRAAKSDAIAEPGSGLHRDPGLTDPLGDSRFRPA